MQGNRGRGKNRYRTSQEGKVTILWNQQVRTDNSITNNKPDIIIREK